MGASEKILGSQRLVCKNPECGYLLKKIYFLEGWEKKSNGNNGVSLVRNNGSSYYECPQCKAKNYIVQQGEKIFLKKSSGMNCTTIMIHGEGTTSSRSINY